MLDGMAPRDVGEIRDADVTFVMQGPVKGPPDVRATVPAMRSLFPASKFILATQESQVAKASDYDCFDSVILTDDPGALPAVKFGGEPHNVNRQITTSAAGLANVRTPYAVKMRTDSYLASRRILDYAREGMRIPLGPRTKGEGRLLVASLYTLNPRYDELIAFHVSDWIHFGRTADVQRMWAAALYDFENATYYERHPYAAHSLPREIEFRARYATEQWLALNYLYGRDAFPIDYHNHHSKELIEEFEQALVDNFIVVHPYDIDLEMPKHKRIYRSKYANLRNYSYEDWKTLVKSLRGHEPGLSGYTAWPRTRFEKALYMIIRKRRFKRSRR